MLVRKDGNSITLRKLEPGMRIGCSLRDRTIFIRDADGKRLYWDRAHGSDDKIFINFAGEADFSMIAYILAETHGLKVITVRSGSDNALLYKFIKGGGR